jgi:hypothetical protein
MADVARTHRLHHDAKKNSAIGAIGPERMSGALRRTARPLLANAKPVKDQSAS